MDSRWIRLVAVGLALAAGAWVAAPAGPAPVAAAPAGKAVLPRT